MRYNAPERFKERRHAVMAEVELTQDALIVHVRGMDQLWAL